MPQMFRTFAEMLRKVDLGFLFQDVALVGRNTVPEFTFPLMEKIDGREVKVLFVPAKHSLPRADVAVR